MQLGMSRYFELFSVNVIMIELYLNFIYAKKINEMFFSENESYIHRKFNDDKSSP